MSTGNFPELVICLLITGSIGIIYILKVSLKSFSEYEYSGDHVLSSVQDSWAFRLFLNILGYATIFMPGYFIFKYVKSSRYLEKRGNGCFPSLIRVCIVGRWSEADPSNEPLSSPTSSIRAPVSRSALHEAGLVLLCFFGLQASYLTWGILQEKVMTQEYLSGLESPGQGAHFRDSQFLVFVNRVLAFLLSGAYILGRRWRRDGKEEPKGPPCPLYKYAYSSFSNLVSSWCQYEALKYVSFPSQVRIQFYAQVMFIEPLRGDFVSVTIVKFSGLLITGSIGIIYILKVSLKSFSEYEYSGDHVLSSVQDSWAFRLFLNILGYATIFMPGYFIFKYVKSSRYLEKRGNGCFPSLIRVCIVGRWSEADPSNEPLSSPTSSIRAPVSRSALHEAGLVLLCFFGLQASYLTWGILQEKVMTQVLLKEESFPQTH
ncbi:hypothetical protein J437_LFUL004506 [Ladona fulva]|uniref:Adenosine 3'-phospho 5'-phosphosulfate transporter 1 n=1 Tax=Ladona fulva TaxID=123851 RepID=A0A8K0KDX1_LADFU|nr:hypothetical protein J437_LFUL004506 [Ladona fulva]